MDKNKLLEVGIKFRAGAFPGETWDSLNAKHGFPFTNGESFRCFVKYELKKQNKLDSSNANDNKVDNNYKVTIDLNKDGSQTSNKLIQMSENQAKDAKFLLKAHGYDPSQFELVSARNSIWNVNTKANGIQTLYSSKIMVKPVSEYIWNEEDIEKLFVSLKTDYKNKIYIQPEKYEKNGNTLVVPIADFHYGLIATHFSTGNDYNIDIAEKYFYYVLNDILSRVSNRKFEKILFVVGNDFINFDNINGTTTKQTQQDNATLWFDVVKDATQLIINGIDMLTTIAPVDVIYVPSNHDLHTMFGIMQTINAWYKDDCNVGVDTSPLPRKYFRVGDMLLYFSHDMKVKNALSIITSAAKEHWSEVKHITCMLAHLHQAMIYEKQGELEIRRLPTISGWSRWSNSMGYVQSEKKNQSFIINKKLGITDIINTIIMEG